MKSQKKTIDAPVRSEWHCVEIVPGANACQTAIRKAGAKFLSKDAPFLPLEGCDRSQCNCIYSHYHDRRQNMRRAAVAPVIGGLDRRGRRGDRRNDGDSFDLGRIPDQDDVRSSARMLSSIVDRLLAGDGQVSLDDFYSAQRQLQERMEWKLLSEDVG